MNFQEGGGGDMTCDAHFRNRTRDDVSEHV